MNNVYFGVFVSSPLMHKWFHDNRTTSLCQGNSKVFMPSCTCITRSKKCTQKDCVMIYHFYFYWCSWAFADLKFLEKSSESVSSVLCIYCPPDDKLSNLQQKKYDWSQRKKICVWLGPYPLDWLLKETQRENLAIKESKKGTIISFRMKSASSSLIF